MSDAWTEGYEAACDGKEPEDNPYYRNDRRHGDWSSGYFSAVNDMADFHDYDE